MTDNELNTAILGLKTTYLSKNTIYHNKMMIGGVTVGARQRDILKAIDIYLQILDYYYYMPDKTISPIEEADILVVIAESTKLLNTFTSVYYDT